VWWEPEQGRWTGADVPDCKADMPPSYVPPDGATAEDALYGDEPFVMQADGRGWLFAPTGVVDGPLPAHYEPHESPFANPLYGQSANPMRIPYEDAESPFNPSAGRPGSDLFPYVVTTYRLTEHHTAGAMSRTLPFLAELQPAMFCEVGPQLAAERGLENGGWATIVTTRTAIEARVLVTDRVPSLRVDGRTVHQVGLPYHWGTRGLTRGDSANDLLHLAADPNVHIQESKAVTCDVRAGRRPRGSELIAFVADYRRRAGIVTEARR
jgi:formate dehydrogenase major subunit